jgi:hypothetical protein
MMSRVHRPELPQAAIFSGTTDVLFIAVLEGVLTEDASVRRLKP